MRVNGSADARRERSGQLWAAIATALWLTLFSGLIEIVIVEAAKRSHPMLRLSRDFAWMAPVALIAATLGAMLPCVLLASIWRRRPTLALVLFVPASLVFLNLLMLVPRLSHYAAAVMAAGLAFQTTRLVLRRPEGARRFVIKSVPILIACLAVVMALAWRPVRPPVARDAAAQPAPGAVRAPNVLLITLDTVRAANLSLYGYSRQTMPRLDQFAGRGVVFEKAFTTAPWTLPSHASLFTGRWPHELSGDYSSPLDGTYPTLAEYLAQHGYETAGFAANLGYCSYQTGLGRGFQHYEDYPRSFGQMASNSTLVRNIADNFKLRRVVQNDQHLNRVSAAELNARALAWLSTRANSPFFVFINYFDAHEPYLPPEPFDRRFGPGRARGQYSPLHRWLWDVSVAHRALTADELREEMDAYDGALAYLDDEVGNLLEALAQRHVLDDTVVMITSDHGEEFGEHGVFDHGYTLYRQALQVPLLVVAPGRVPEGSRVMRPVTLRDVPATIVDVIGLKTGAPFPGESLASLWNPLKSADRPSQALLSEVSRASGQPPWFPASKGDLKAVFYRGFHYIRNSDGSEELYEVEGDPGERNNLSALPDHRDILIASRAALREFDGGRSRFWTVP